jgi:hypothetical protein
MFRTSLKTLRLATLASLILVAAAACSNITPAPQVAASDLAAQNAWAEGGN